MPDIPLFISEILHKSDTENNSFYAHLYNLLGYLPDGYLIKDMSGTLLYDLYSILADEIVDAENEILAVKSDTFLSTTRINRLYDIFGILLNYPKQIEQDWEDYNSTYLLQGYRPGLSLLNEGAMNGGTSLALRRVGHAVTGVAPLIKEFYKNQKWLLSGDSGSITSIPSKYSISDSTKNWIPDEWVNDYIEFINNSTHINNINDPVVSFGSPQSYPIDTTGVRLIRIGSAIFGIGGSDAINNYDSVYKNTIKSDGTLTGWTIQATLPTSVGAYSGVTVGIGNRIYVIGGIDYTTNTPTNTVYYSNPIQESSDPGLTGEVTEWFTGASLPVALSGCGIIYYTGYLTVFGGTAIGGLPVDTIYYAVVNINGNITSWDVSTSLPSNRGDVCALLGPDGFVYLFGGYDGASYLDSIMYSFMDQGQPLSWNIATAVMDIPKSLVSCDFLNGFIYVAGGYDGSFHTEVSRFALVSNDLLVSSIISDLGSISDGPGLVAYDTELYALFNNLGSDKIFLLDTSFLIDSISLSAPKGLTIIGQYIYITDTGNNTILKFRHSDDVPTSIHYVSRYSDLIYSFDAPEDIVAVGDYVYIVDTVNDHVVKVQSSLAYDSFIGYEGSTGSGDNDFNVPTGIAYGNDGIDNVLFIADSGNNRIIVRKLSDLSFKNKIVGLNSPKKVAAYGTTLYVANTGDNNVLIIDAITGLTIYTISGLNAPEGISVNAGYIWVSNTGTNELYRYNRTTYKFVNKTISYNVEDTLNTPTGMGVDENYVIVADTGNNRVSIWESANSNLLKVIDNTNDTLISEDNLIAYGIDGTPPVTDYKVGKSFLNESTYILSDDMEYYGMEAHFWGPFEIIYNSYRNNIKKLCQDLSEILKPAHTYIKYIYHTDLPIVHAGQDRLASGSYDIYTLSLISGTLSPKFPTVTTIYSGSIGIPSGSLYTSDILDLGENYSDFDWYIDFCARVSNNSSGSLEIINSDYENYWGLADWVHVKQDDIIYHNEVKRYLQYRYNFFASGSNDMEFRGFALRPLIPNEIPTFEWID